MWLLYVFYAAVWPILLHPLNQHSGLFCRILQLLVLLPNIFDISLGVLLRFLSLDVDSGNCFLNNHIKGSLAKMVKHEEMMRQVSKLGLETEPV